MEIVEFQATFIEHVACSRARGQPDLMLGLLKASSIVLDELVRRER